MSPEEKAADTISQYIPLVRLKMVKEKRLKYSAFIGQPDSIIKLVWSIFRGSDRELFVVVGLDTKNVPTVINVISMGTADSTIVHPREVFKPLILSSSSSFICLHNHPTGHVEPSSADKTTTENLIQAGKILQIMLLDHLIVGDSPHKFLSFRRVGLLKSASS
jgi:DNA repair protein RadC